MRTVKEFVKQLFQEGKGPKHIRAVAQCSCWKNKLDEVEHWIKKGIKIMKKKKNRKSKNSTGRGKVLKKLRIKRNPN